jgi:hypothetical protein
MAIAAKHASQNFVGARGVWKAQVAAMSRVAGSSAIPPISGFPEVIDVHWETQRHVVWNERERTREEHELVYEISWIGELGLWRTFLRSHHKVDG